MSLVDLSRAIVSCRFFFLPFGAVVTEAAAKPVNGTAQTDDAWESEAVCASRKADGATQLGGLVPKQVVPAAVEQCERLREGQRPHRGVGLDHF